MTGGGGGAATQGVTLLPNPAPWVVSAVSAEDSGHFIVAYNSSATCSLQNPCSFEVRRVEPTGASTVLYAGEGEVHSVASVPASAGGGVAFAGLGIRVLQGMTLTSACVRGDSSRVDRVVVAQGSTCVRVINFSLNNTVRQFTRGVDRLLIDSVGRIHLGVHGRFAFTPTGSTGSAYFAGDTTDGCAVVSFSAAGDFDAARSQNECTIASLRERSDGALVVGGWSYLTITGDHWVSGRGSSARWVSTANAGGGGTQAWVLTVDLTSQEVLDAWRIDPLVSSRYDIPARQNLGAVEPLGAGSYVVVGRSGETSTSFSNPATIVPPRTGVVFLMTTPTFLGAGPTQMHGMGWRALVSATPAPDDVRANRVVLSRQTGGTLLVGFLLDPDSTQVQVGSVGQAVSSGTPGVRFGTARFELATGTASAVDLYRSPGAAPLAFSTGSSPRLFARFWDQLVSLDGTRSASAAGENAVIAPLR